MSSVDPMDIAYLAIGAKQALVEHLAEKGDQCGPGAEMEYIGEIIQYATLLDDIYKEVEEQWESVWAYEVAEAAGLALGRAYLDGKLTYQEAERIVRELVDECLAETLH